jgi:hypothetical protein
MNAQDQKMLILVIQIEVSVVMGLVHLHTKQFHLVIQIVVSVVMVFAHLHMKM